MPTKKETILINIYWCLLKKKQYLSIYIDIIVTSICRGESVEKEQIIFSKIFLIFKLKYFNNYLIKFAKKFFILILKLYTSANL